MIALAYLMKHKLEVKKNFNHRAEISLNGAYTGIAKS